MMSSSTRIGADDDWCNGMSRCWAAVGNALGIAAQ
jgi:hypothetical protein